MTRYKSSNSGGDCQRTCNAMRGALASIIADPDCCAASKAIARDALTYHVNSASADDMSLVPEMIGALVEAKRELWSIARHQWNLADFKNWAVVQQIDGVLAKARGGTDG